MPQILVVAEAADGDVPETLLTERVAPDLLESEHYAAQLLERVRWAVEDAADIEHRGQHAVTH
jgi:hypothetical protein